MYTYFKIFQTSKLSFNILLVGTVLAFLSAVTYTHADVVAPEELLAIPVDVATSTPLGTTTTEEKLPRQIHTQQENRTEVQQERPAQQQLRQEKQDSISNNRQIRITNLAANMSNRIEAAIERFTKISTRIETRISKLEQAGIDTTDAKQKLSVAQETLNLAQTNISTIDILVYNATTSQTPKEDWSTVKQTFLATGKLLRESQQELREVVKSLKEAIRVNKIGEKIERPTTDPSKIPEAID